MDESSMIERLRFDADQIDTEDTDVDALVGGALRQGHRRRARRRVGAAVTGSVVAVGLAAAVLVGGATSARTGVPVPAPAGPSVSSAATPSAKTPSATATSAPPASTGRLSGAPAQVEVTLATLLPKSITVTRAVSDSSTAAEGRELNAYLVLRDAAGVSNTSAGVGAGRYTDICASNNPCTETEVGGGTLWVTGGGPDPDKAGDDQSVFYNRPAGGHVWLTQTNFADGNGPVTRPGLPLTDSEVRALVTSSAWDRFFQG